ncbi:MAG: FecR family protein [Asticcacaulis sp.]
MSERPALTEVIRPKALRHEANRWLMRRDCGLMTEADEAQCQEWLAADPRHRQAYAEAEALFGAIDANVLPVKSVEKRTLKYSGRALVGGALAAGLAMAVIWGSDMPVRIQSDYMTARGEQKTITLSDGSTVMLNGDTALKVDFNKTRNLRLLRGEAAFQVAADPARQFTVETAKGATTALGTRFIVRRTDSQTAQVIVTEHSVRVTHGDEKSVVAQGYGLSYGTEGLGAVEAVRVSDADAWTRGHLRFVDQPLSQVVDELNRYHKGRIFLVGKDIKAMPVNGLFDIHDTEGALLSLEQALGLKARHLGAGIVILEK